MDNFKRLFPTEFYAKFIESNIRPDGRPLRKSRKITIGAGARRLARIGRPLRRSVGSIGTADGSSLVRLGHTSVIAGAKVRTLSIPAARAAWPPLAAP